MDHFTEQLLTGICAAAREAGGIMLRAERGLEGEGNALGVEDKGGHANFVTRYDKKVQGLLEKELHVLLPQARFIGEEDVAAPSPEETPAPPAPESASTDDAGKCGDSYTFVIDPIDGTSNFMKDLQASVVSIALLKNGTPYIGVVYQPYADMLYHAARGCGAFVQEGGNSSRHADDPGGPDGGNDPAGRIVTRPLHSSRDPLARSFVMIGTSPYYPEFMDATFRLYAHYLPKCIDLRRFGAAAWELCLAASGRVGLFLELHLQLWDFAAGALIAEEAGCRVTDIDGRPLRFDGPSSVAVASEGVAREPYLDGTEEILAGLRGRGL